MRCDSMVTGISTSSFIASTFEQVTFSLDLHGSMLFSALRSMASLLADRAMRCFPLAALAALAILYCSQRWTSVYGRLKYVQGPFWCSGLLDAVRGYLIGVLNLGVVYCKSWSRFLFCSSSSWNSDRKLTASCNEILLNRLPYLASMKFPAVLQCLDL